MATHNLACESLPIKALLGGFLPIQLDEMRDVALQDRQETKYVFSAALLCELLGKASAHYRVLAVAGEPLNRYRTLYFDTPSLDFYHRHLAGAPIRTKVRSREYVETKTAFLEVKQRTNRKRTGKRRLATERMVTSLHGEYSSFVAGEIAGDAHLLEPVLWITYHRLTLVGMQRPERVTLDLGLRFEGGGMLDASRNALLDGIVIAEVKQPRVDRSSPFVELLRTAHVRPASFSKYCMGVSTLLPEIPRHKINKTHRLVNRLQHGNDAWIAAH